MVTLLLEGKHVQLKRPIKLLTDPQVARLLLDPSRRLILTNLEERPMTGAQLARTIGIAPSTISFHLNLMRKNGLVRVAKVVAQPRGIPQKYFSSKALWSLDSDRMPVDVKRFGLFLCRERLIGVFSSLQAFSGKKHRIESFMMDELTRQVLHETARIFKRYSGKTTSKNRDTLIVDVFAEGLGEVMARGETDAAQFLRKTLAGSGLALKPISLSQGKRS